MPHRRSLTVAVLGFLAGCSEDPCPQLEGGFERRAPMQYGEQRMEDPETDAGTTRLGIPFAAAVGDEIVAEIEGSYSAPSAWLIDEAACIVAVAKPTVDFATSRLRQSARPQEWIGEHVLVVEPDEYASEPLRVSLSGPTPERRYQQLVTKAADEDDRASDAANAGTWIRCYAHYTYGCHLVLGALQGDYSGWECNEPVHQNVVSYCVTFDPADEEESCEASGNVICANGECTIIDCPNADTGCGPRHGDPAECIDFVPPVTYPEELPCACAGHTIVTYEGWVSADPECCARTDECTGDREPEPWVAADATCNLPQERVSQETEVLRHKVVGKSYIDHIRIENADNIAMQVMARVLGVHEYPTDDAKLDRYANGYRMRTQMSPVLECQDGRAVAGYIDDALVSMGFEEIPRGCIGDEGEGCSWWLTGVVVQASAEATSLSDECVEFETRVGGRPHPWASFALNLLTGFVPSTIRHATTAVMCCDGSTQFAISGTPFPSHRLFVDGEIRDTLIQGPLESLVRIDNPDWQPESNVCYLARFLLGACAT